MTKVLVEKGRSTNILDKVKIYIQDNDAERKFFTDIRNDMRFIKDTFVNSMQSLYCNVMCCDVVYITSDKEYVVANNGIEFQRITAECKVDKTVFIFEVSAFISFDGKVDFALEIKNEARHTLLISRHDSFMTIIEHTEAFLRLARHSDFMAVKG